MHGATITNHKVTKFKNVRTEDYLNGYCNIFNHKTENILILDKN